MSDQRPDPLVPADVDLRDTPMPRETLIKLAMFTFGLSETDAALMSDRYFAERPH